ncbi:MAG TPA: SRPBCC domain-containing protein [Pirellulales bacterium]|jgi:carbon monoxide dehydrogenase subunit G|nr:SRPBCC domain-containing protein [Pirellulales bacterium]
MPPPQQLEFGGTQQFSAPAERVFSFLTDLDAVASLIPDLQSSKRTGPQTVECVVRPGFSFLRGTLKLRIEIGNLEPPKRATMFVTAQGIGITMRIESQLDVEPTTDGSQLIWTARVTDQKGLVASLSPALVRAAADQVIRHAWEKVGERMNAE